MKIIYCPNAGGGCEKNGLGTERIPLSFFLLFIGEAEVDFDRIFIAIRGFTDLKMLLHPAKE